MAAVLGLVILATGCAVRPPESRIGKISAGAPERWIASKAAKAGIDQDWIKRFGDSQLVALVDESMKNNPDLRIAAERVRRAEAVARLSGAARKVQVSGKINGQLQKQRFPGFPLNLGSNTAEVYGASLDVNWELDLWGRLRATQRAAMADKQAQEQDYRAARTSLAAQLAKAWFALGEANEQIGLAQAAILVRDKTARSIRERFTAALEGGLASQLRLAETDLAGSRAALARWQAERERALRQVELLVGRYPKGNLLSRRVLPKAPAAPPAGLASELLLRRPDILAAERRYAAAGSRFKAARLAHYPSFSLTGRRGTSTDVLHEVLDSRFGVWSLSGGLVQPLLSGGRLRQEAKIAGHDEEIALRELQRIVLRGFGEVEQALVAEEYFAKRERAVAESARSAREAAEAAIVDFADGAVEALTLLSAQDRQVQTAFQLASLRRMRLDNRVNLHLSLGGDFKLREQQ
jgi:NodT family efflux transporter outer membrane factor (OMF) lipoprotein|tara:strand:+ start:1892 stop:3289 length:1398 start_codon:yes stop_codon:yes gene_type:complete